MTNQTQILSAVDAGTSGPVVPIDTLVNDFITTGMALGYINFEVRQVVVTTQYSGGPGLATGANFYTVQVNYYNPALY